MSSSSRPPGTLIVEVPHWAATVRVLDNLCETAIPMNAPADMGNGVFQVTQPLKPGVYKVDVALGSTSDSEWVTVRPEKETRIPASRWKDLYLASAAPIQTTSSGGPGVHASAAEDCSRTLTWAAPQPGPARLFVFVHTPDAKKYPNFSEGLTLLDAHASPLVALGDGSTTRNPTEGWMAFTTDLPGGFYMLRRNGPGAVWYHQPLYLCESWETQVFIAGGEGPSFRSVTINMAPHGAGFRHDDETAAATVAVLTALQNELGMRAVLGSAQLSRMLRQEGRNPWLGVLAVHAIDAIQEEARAEGVPPTVSANNDPALRNDIIQFLNATIGHHPDVRALQLPPDASAPQPFDFPPMLRIGLRRVQRHATKFADTIPVGSLTDRMLDRQVTSSAWSAWRQPAEISQAAESTPRKAAAPKRRTRRAAAVLHSAFAPNAPIFQAPVAAGAAPPGSSELGRLLYDLPVIRAAQRMLGQRGTSLPDKIVIDSKGALSSLLEGVDARAVSAASGIPLGRTERTINRLRRSIQTGTTLPDAGKTMNAVMEYALRQSTRGRRPPADPIQDPAEAAKSVAGPRPDSVGHITLEECVSKLRAGAAQLTAGDPAASEADRARAEQLSRRLDAIAHTLLGHADLIAITGPAGQFLYGNGAFTMLMALTGGSEPLKASRRWCRWLSQLPLGRSSNLTSPLDPSGRLWTVHRSAVEYETGGSPGGYVNILDDERLSQLPENVFDEIAATVSEVTLHASFVQYGSPPRRSASLGRLEEIAAGLEQRLFAGHGVVSDGERTQMAITRFDAPGFLQDWNEAAAKKWSEWISARLDEARAADGAAEGLSGYGPRLQFFNPLKTPPDAGAVDKDIEWSAFPRIVQLQSISDRQRWRTADSSRDTQDEYCEWSVTRDPATDKIRRVTFTSEGPEYWQFLAAVAPDKVLQLYQQHVSPDVKRADLFRNGRYVPRNRWNNSTTAGAMHLIQINNTLGAEIELAAAATIVRTRNGAPLTEAQALIACGQYGQEQRHSDPLIGATVNELARMKADITLKNPVGLYIAGLSVAGWQTPDGSDALSFWTITRGTKDKALRAVFEVPAAKGFLVGDISINGKPIEFGAQIADFIRIKLTGTAARIGQSTVAPFDTCVTQEGAAEPIDTSALDVESVLRSSRVKVSR